MVQGGIFLRKMPLGIEDSVKTRIETAVERNQSYCVLLILVQGRLSLLVAST
jgi:hypothetical protein